MKPKILFKFPSRGRVDQFFEALDSIVNNLYDLENYHISATLDYDDLIMNQPAIVDRILCDYKNISIAWGKSDSKISAVNRSIPDYPFDIICCHSDDMQWTFFGFDEILRQEFLDGDFDKLLHVPDTDAKSALATYYIAGRDYYNRFGYIYHPSYVSLFADNEVQDIAKRMGKYRYVNSPGMLFHKHPSYGHRPFDIQYREQQGFWGVDEANYYARKARNFEL